jgi:hypothetical protein
VKNELFKPQGGEIFIAKGETLGKGRKKIVLAEFLPFSAKIVTRRVLGKKQ